MDVLADFLNIGSITAFVGAFTAYLLVLLTDHRRTTRRYRMLQMLIETSRDLCRSKIETVKMNKRALVEDNTVIPAPIMKFALDDIEHTKREVLDRLRSDEKRALDALSYTMKEIDNIFDQILSLAERLFEQIKSGELPSSQRESGQRLVAEYDSVLVNLRRLEDMASMYLRSEFRTILSKGYKASDYADDPPN